MFAKNITKQKFSEWLVVQGCVLAMFATIFLTNPYMKPSDMGMPYDLAKAHRQMEEAHNLMNPVNATDIPQNEKAHRAATLQSGAMRELMFAVSAAEQRAQKAEVKLKEFVVLLMVAGFFGLLAFTLIGRMRRNIEARPTDLA